MTCFLVEFVCSIWRDFKSQSRQAKIKFLAYLILSLLNLTMVVLLINFGYVGLLNDWIRDHRFYGGLVIVGILILISIPFPFPFIYMTMLGIAGSLFQLKGLLVVIAGTSVGSTIVLLSSRFFRVRLNKFVDQRPKVAKFRYHLENSSSRHLVVVLLRFTPIPMGLQNGLLMFSSLPFYVTLPLSWIGMLPLQILLIVGGSSISSISQIASASAGEIAQLLAPIVAMCVVFVIFAFFAKKAFTDVDENPELLKNNIVLKLPTDREGTPAPGIARRLSTQTQEIFRAIAIYAKTPDPEKAPKKGVKSNIKVKAKVPQSRLAFEDPAARGSASAGSTSVEPNMANYVIPATIPSPDDTERGSQKLKISPATIHLDKSGPKRSGGRA